MSDEVRWNDQTREITTYDRRVAIELAERILEKELMLYPRKSHVTEAHWRRGDIHKLADFLLMAAGKKRVTTIMEDNGYPEG